MVKAKYVCSYYDDLFIIIFSDYRTTLSSLGWISRSVHSSGPNWVAHGRQMISSEKSYPKAHLNWFSTVCWTPALDYVVPVVTVDAEHVIQSPGRTQCAPETKSLQIFLPCFSVRQFSAVGINTEQVRSSFIVIILRKELFENPIYSSNGVKCLECILAM